MKNKKFFSLLLSSLLLSTGSIAYATTPVQTTSAVNTHSTLTVNDTLISMTDKETLHVQALFNTPVTEDTLALSFGDKALSDWQIWNNEISDYTGGDYITPKNLSITETVVDGQTAYLVSLDLDFGHLFNTTDLSPRNIRVLYPEFIGDYTLALTNTTTQEKHATAIALNAYDSFRPFDTIKPELDAIIANAPSSMHLSYESIGKSVEGRDQHMIILAKDEASVDAYLNETVPLMLENPEVIQKAIADGTNTHKFAVFINNIHPDETPGISAQLDFLQSITTTESIPFNSVDAEGNTVVKTLNIQDALEEMVIVMCLTENPDGSANNTRSNANGFDLNRDNGYQTQIETQNIVTQIAKWVPLSFLDLHGFVNSFLIEPCTPPHEQNNEYDLLLEHQIEQAQAMGDAGIGNTIYESYEIPAIADVYRNPDGSWADVWDDGTISYTATFAQNHGALGHTIEIPDLNQASNDAATYALFGAIEYLTQNTDELFNNQLEYYKRGIEGVDSKTVDPYLVNAKNEVIGRDRQGHQNFFPNYYVLPVDATQQNPAAVYDMVAYLQRNGVRVDTLSETTTIGDTTYAAGSYVIDMAQAKRGFANTVLYKGANASDFPSIYAEIVVNFPDLRGFDVFEVRTADAFESILKEVTSTPQKSTPLPKSSDFYILKNNSLDAVEAVNTLFDEELPVRLFTQDSEAHEVGDFLISADALPFIVDDYSLQLEPYAGTSRTKPLTQPIVYAEGIYSQFILDELGFETTTDISEASIIVDEKGNIAAEAITNGVDFLGIGKAPLTQLGETLMPGLETNEDISYKEGLVYATYDAAHALTSGYDTNVYAYTTSGAWIEKVPNDVTTLLQIADIEDFYISGWWPNFEEAQGKTLGVTKTVEDSIITFYANNFTNRAHNEASFRLMSNAIYQSTLEK